MQFVSITVCLNNSAKLKLDIQYKANYTGQS